MLLFSVVIFVVVVIVLFVYIGVMIYVNVIGLLVGGVFVLGILCGYLVLVCDGWEWCWFIVLFVVI